MQTQAHINELIYLKYYTTHYDKLHFERAKYCNKNYGIDQPRIYVKLTFQK